MSTPNVADNAAPRRRKRRRPVSVPDGYQRIKPRHLAKLSPSAQALRRELIRHRGRHPDRFRVSLKRVAEQARCWGKGASMPYRTAKRALNELRRAGLVETVAPTRKGVSAEGAAVWTRELVFLRVSGVVTDCRKTRDEIHWLPPAVLEVFASWAESKRGPGRPRASVNSETLAPMSVNSAETPTRHQVPRSKLRPLFPNCVSLTSPKGDTPVPGPAAPAVSLQDAGGMDEPASTSALMRSCSGCGDWLGLPKPTGRPRQWCGDACRKRAQRGRQHLPAQAALVAREQPEAQPAAAQARPVLAPRDAQREQAIHRPRRHAALAKLAASDFGMQPAELLELLERGVVSVHAVQNLRYASGGLWAAR